MLLIGLPALLIAVAIVLSFRRDVRKAAVAMEARSSAPATEARS
jgi:hypothetical protein